jgi:hypothetical protein
MDGRTTGGARLPRIGIVFVERQRAERGKVDYRDIEIPAPILLT